MLLRQVLNRGDNAMKQSHIICSPDQHALFPIISRMNISLNGAPYWFSEMCMFYQKIYEQLAGKQL